MYHQHLAINAKKEFFRLYLEGKEYKAGTVTNSASYVPLIVIDPDSLGPLYRRKTRTNNFKTIIDAVINTSQVKFFEDPSRDAIFSNFQSHFITIKGPPNK